MFQFTRMPSAEIRTGGLLTKFQGQEGAAALKALLGAIIIRGKLEAEHYGVDLRVFPVTLDALQEAAHLSRVAAVQALRHLKLIALDRIEDAPLRDALRQKIRFHGRTPLYRLRGPDHPFAPIPWAAIDASNLLASLHNQSPIARAAMKLLILFCALRNNKSGKTIVGYDGMARYGVSREHIRKGLSLLFEHELVDCRPNVVTGDLPGLFRGLGTGVYYVNGLKGPRLKRLGTEDQDDRNAMDDPMRGDELDADGFPVPSPRPLPAGGSLHLDADPTRRGPVTGVEAMKERLRRAAGGFRSAR